MEKKTKEQKEQEFLTYLINKYHLIYNDDTCLYDCQKSIRFQNIDVRKGHFPIKFGKVKGDFICVNCTELTSLKGAPEEVTGNFDCSGCTGINSLIGSPKKVGKDYICSNTGISTIRGITEEIKNFKCTLNNNLLSLVNGPKYVEDNYDVSN